MKYDPGDVIVAHLSDLHIRDEHDAIELEHQLDRIVARHPDHLAITGDLLDRWDPSLLGRVVDALDARGLMDRDKLTILHGNHDLASSGGHPRERSDLWRLAARFWDPPPLVAARRRAFYRDISARAAGVAALPPSMKTTRIGLRLATMNSVPSPWVPFTIGRGRLILQHARGRITDREARWLSQQRGLEPLVVLMHHYPLPVDPFTWTVERGLDKSAAQTWMNRLADWQVVVPIEIPAAGRAKFWDAAERAGVVLVLCGHVHRARLEHRGATAVGLNGQSGAAWAGRTIAYYRIDGDQVSVEHDAQRAA